MSAASIFASCAQANVAAKTRATVSNLFIFVCCNGVGKFKSKQPVTFLFWGRVLCQLFVTSPRIDMIAYQFEGSELLLGAQ
jgi:hypothetical protein